jgi:hypothetical protein
VSQGANEIHIDLITHGKKSLPRLLPNRYLGVAEEKPHLLFQVFQDHNDKVEALIGVDFTYLPGTVLVNLHPTERYNYA